MDSHFACRTDQLSGSRALVTASGELDLHACLTFRKAIDGAARRAPEYLVFDFSGVTFMDSTALSMLAAEQRRREEPMHVVARAPQLLRILRVTGYDRVFAVHPSLEEALLETGRRRADNLRPDDEIDLPPSSGSRRAGRWRAVGPRGADGGPHPVAAGVDELQGAARENGLSATGDDANVAAAPDERRRPGQDQAPATNRPRPAAPSAQKAAQ